jgi:hypothetical protein
MFWSETSASEEKKAGLNPGQQFNLMSALRPGMPGME